MLNLHWGELVLPLKIKVEPIFKVTTLDDEAALPYIGRYSYNIVSAGVNVNRSTLTVVAVEGQLRDYVGASESIQFVPMDGKHGFLLGSLRNGKIVNLQDFPLAFQVGSSGRGSGFNFRHDPGEVWIYGERLA